MPVTIGKGDLRSVKTARALDIAMLSLLEIRSFRKITVKDICDKALVSRATFYAYFPDKYAMLKERLICLMPEILVLDEPYEKVEMTINQFVHRNQTVIKNLVYCADDETVEILQHSFESALGLQSEKNEDEKINPKYVVLSRFYSGGMYQYLLWQVKNKFPLDVAPMNTHLYAIIEKFHEWNLKD